MNAKLPTIRFCARAARIVVLGTAVLLGACETTPEVAAVDDPERVFAERLVRLAAIEQWSAIGKLGIQSARDSWSAGVHWRQNRDSYSIRLSGPLGQGLMELYGSPGLVEMRTAQDGVYRAQTAEELMLSHAGWRVPLTGLRYWILGMPDPQARVVALELDAGGRLAELRQLGWLIRFQGYEEFDGIALPTRLTLENPRIRGKLIVRSWHTGPEST
ncbi:MAG: outer membrane lipoprotein LolB [Gammaproteobacteria bacterium]|nr:outer membrane lipoprotein LolB [Gammaproteobacteria bacterium]NIM74472.1 outer membrane lipoprotein LolB [Gammaproteobacteria bacterium]NIO26305.1 outer membrane lipoprotein LolB [Gammaproteobacteria bacterium]NIO66857.1 outer membrane lipoprotein LolB [Gammaproteobacteria bacterium]NIP45168.1 outer membrane lipoprotein LolB [Gammaproteobacteria bacterium]